MCAFCYDGRFILETLKKQRDFDRVYNKGRSSATKYLVLYWYQINDKNRRNNRFGFSISRKVGNAVTRNKIRRQLKEIIRLNYDSIKKGFDCIFIVRPAAVKLDFYAFKKNVIKLLKRADLWSEL